MPYRPHASDLILTGGIVYTMNAHDLTATALAIKDGKMTGAGGRQAHTEIPNARAAEMSLLSRVANAKFFRCASSR